MESTSSNQILILQEVDLHPNSVIVSLRSKFEKPSCVHIVTREGLKRYNSPPVYDNNYLVTFESAGVFEKNLSFLNLDYMMPVILCSTKGSAEDAILLCREKRLPYRHYVNEFKRDDAIKMIQSLTEEQLTENFCKTLVSRVGLSPRRLVSAMMVCDHVGYTASNVSKYIDKYTYIDTYDLLHALLGIIKSKAQLQRARLFLHSNRLWYKKSTQKKLLTDVEVILKVYRDLLSGELTEFSLNDYVERERIPRYRVLAILEMYSKIGIDRILIMQRFLETATLLEVALVLPIEFRG